MDEHPASFDSNSSEASPDASLDANAQVWSAEIQAAATDRQTDATDRQTEAQLKAAEITAGATDRQTGATDRQTVVQTVAMTAFSLFGIGWTELKAYSPFVLAVLLTGTIWKRELLRDVYKDIVLFLRATIAPQLWPRGEIAENKTTIDRAASMGTDITRDCDFDIKDTAAIEKGELFFDADRDDDANIKLQKAIEDVERTRLRAIWRGPMSSSVMKMQL